MSTTVTKKSTKVRVVEQPKAEVKNVEEPVEQPVVETQVETKRVKPEQVKTEVKANGDAKKTAGKGGVYVVTTQKPTKATTPRAKSPENTQNDKPVRSPRTPQAKKTTRRVLTVTNGNGKSKVVNKSVKNDAEKPRRQHNVKQTSIMLAGIGVATAKVRRVLLTCVLNKEAHDARQAISAAENKPVRPKPTDENPDPVMPAQGPQKSIDKLDYNVRQIINAAEKAYAATLLSDYEHEVVKGMNAETREKYDEAKKQAHKKEDFNLRSFNESFDPHFYDGHKKWVKDNDNYSVDRVTEKDGKQQPRYNQWSRASTLIGKTCTRLSSGVREIFASWLDLLIMQYTVNGITNCIAEGKNNVHPHHALAKTDGFEERVPFDRFARSLDGYENANKWIEDRDRVRADAVALRQKLSKKHNEKGEIETVVVDMPKYPDDDEKSKVLESYVVEICRHVRIVMARNQKSTATRDVYYNIKISDNFKKFCAIMAYEAIARIGSALKKDVVSRNIKTVTSDVMMHILEQVSNLNGFSFANVRTEIESKVSKYREFSAERRDQRKRQRQSNNDDDDDDEDDDDEDDVPVQADSTDDVVAADDGDEELEVEEEEVDEE